MGRPVRTEVDVLVADGAQAVGDHRVADLGEVHHAAGGARAVGRAEVVPCQPTLSEGWGVGATRQGFRTGGESHGRVDDAVVEGGERGRGGEQQQRAAGHQGAVGDHVSARGRG